MVATFTAALVVTSFSPVAGASETFQPTPAAVAKYVTGVSLAVFNKVGVRSSVVEVTTPTVISGQPALNWAIKGKARPTIFFYGSEYISFSGAEMWPIIVALSRFGSLTGLGDVASASSEVYPGTQSFTFLRTKFTSSYVNFFSVERWSTVPAHGGGFQSLQKPSKGEQAIINKYDVAKYLPGAGSGVIPFLDVGNKVLIGGSSFSPADLQGWSRSQLAQGLSDANNPTTEGIVATANMLTAAICSTTDQKPGSVCGSKGVKAADKLMHLAS